MSHRTSYSRDRGEQDRWVNEVHVAIMQCPDGITCQGLLRLGFAREVLLPSIKLLKEERKITSDGPFGGPDFVRMVKVRPNPKVKDWGGLGRGMDMD
jgi:hypothetical protein